MSSILGYNDMKSWALPVGWDATELQKYAMADGSSAEEIFNDLLAGLIAASQSMLSHPIYGGLVSTTEEIGREYRNGSASSRMSKRAEYTKADPKKATTIGHMFPKESYDYTLGFTMDFLREARRGQIDANIADAIDAIVNEYQISVLTRFFSNTENLMGSGGYDVPFVAGGGNVPHVPPQYQGFSFDSTHTHFARDTVANRAVAIEAGVVHLLHHGINGPWIGLVPFADISTYAGLTNFRKPQRENITYANTTNLAQINEEVFFGVYESEHGLILLHATNRLPTNYFGLYKSYGNDDPRNPLVVRVARDYKFTPIAMRGEGFKVYPLENMVVIHEYGVGVRDRLNGYAIRFAASGDYSNPTIS